MSFYQIYLNYLATEREYILTLEKQVCSQIPEVLVFGSDSWWTSTNLFTNAKNDIVFILDFESGYQNILPNKLLGIQNKLELGYLFFDTLSDNRNGWECTSNNNFLSIMNNLIACTFLYSSLDVGYLHSLNSYH